MLRSLYAGISGLRSQQTLMDVTGNNIANVNTTAFKSSSTQFEDTLSQVVPAAGRATAGQGGTNPAQIGLGVRVAGITTNFTQGAAQLTGKSTDMMIQGDGMFVVKSGNEQMYTRNGSFSFDALGQLVTADGAILQGWKANADGTVPTTGEVSNLTIPAGTLRTPQKTTTLTLGGNLAVDAAVGAVGTTVTAGSRVGPVNITTYDALGNSSAVAVTFVHTLAATAPTTGGEWSISTDGGATVNNSTKIVFNADGTPNLTGTVLTLADGKKLNINAMTGYAGTNKQSAGIVDSTATITAQDGAPAGTIASFSLGADGTITGTFDNGFKQTLGKVALASFSNSAGLSKSGNSLYSATTNSGFAQVGAAGSAGRGSLAGGTLEMSNVDLSQEFTNLIVAQRGFQASSRVITASDEMLQELGNMKR